jgi:FlaG/FlaF family flagellin (archaellin)
VKERNIAFPITAAILAIAMVVMIAAAPLTWMTPATSQSSFRRIINIPILAVARRV